VRRPTGSRDPSGLCRCRTEAAESQANAAATVRRETCSTAGMKPALASALLLAVSVGSVHCAPTDSEATEESEGAQAVGIPLEKGLAEVNLNSSTAGTVDLLIEAPGRSLQVDLSDETAILGTAIGSTPLRLRAMNLLVKTYSLRVRALDQQAGGSFTIKRQTVQPFERFELPAYIVGQPAANEGDARARWLEACTAWTRAQVGLYAAKGFTPASFQLINKLDCGTPTKIAGRQQFESLGQVRVVTDPLANRPQTQDLGTSGDVMPESKEGEALGSWMTACLRDLARRRDERAERFLITSCTEKPQLFNQDVGVDFSGPTRLLFRQ
jgi:hypothetical protein